jgi:hypothetical protein
MENGEPMHPKRNFWDYVKNPRLFREETAAFARACVGGPPSPRQLDALVETIGQRKLTYKELQRIQRAGEQAVPPLLAAIRVESFLFRRYGESVLDGSVIKTALDLLEPFALPPAAVLEKVLRCEDKPFREYALYHLARCGNDDAIEALRDGLRSESEGNRTWTLMGLEFLKESKRGSTRFRGDLFDAVVPVLADDRFGPAEHAPRALLALDFQRANYALLRDDVLSAENRAVYRVLEALKDANVAVPASRLRALLGAIEPKAAGFPFDYAYGEGLLLLARAEGAGAKDVIADAQGWGNDQVQEGAAEALGVAAGLKNVYGFVVGRYSRAGEAGLTQPQLYYLALSWLDGEVSNGGFAQFYFNSSGELASYAVEAANAVGASQVARIVQEANALFGKSGPSRDRDRRMDQLSGIDEGALSALDQRYYKCGENVGVLLAKFVAANAEEFRSGT